MRKPIQTGQGLCEAMRKRSPVCRLIAVIVVIAVIAVILVIAVIGQGLGRRVGGNAAQADALQGFGQCELKGAAEHRPPAFEDMQRKPLLRLRQQHDAKRCRRRLKLRLERAEHEKGPRGSLRRHLKPAQRLGSYLGVADPGDQASQAAAVQRLLHCPQAVDRPLRFDDEQLLERHAVRGQCRCIGRHRRTKQKNLPCLRTQFAHQRDEQSQLANARTRHEQLGEDRAGPAGTRQFPVEGGESGGHRRLLCGLRPSVGPPDLFG